MTRDPTADADGPGVEHARAAARLAKVVEVAVGEVDLTLPQYRMLAHLAEGSGGASALAGTLAVSRPSITALADGLVARGLVERCAHAGDRRRVDHLLTADGRTALAAGDEAVERRLADLVVHLPVPQRRRALDGLARWLSALDAARAARLARR
ncbi:MAG: MarR family winged helix-turn-helix transcriptional regulator [Acidimicrobiales bacterium]